jgi:hypothetical protein
MGLFGKKKSNNEQYNELNRLLNLALEMDQNTGTWLILPEDVSVDTKETVINARKMIFEYIRQLKEAKFYSNSAVHKFAKEQYSWVNKENIQKFIELGKFL